MSNDANHNSARLTAILSDGEDKTESMTRRSSFFPGRFPAESAIPREFFSQIAKSLVNSESPGHTRPLSADEQRRKNYASLNLVHCCWIDRGDHREIGDARAHDALLDNRGWHHRVDHRRRRYLPVLA